MKVICTLCNYVFEQEVGLPESGIKAGTKLEDFPEDWQCPDCGAAKEFLQTCSCASYHKVEKENSRAICTLCNYVYEQAQGNPEAGIRPGTKFEHLSNDWQCPVCAAAKEYFEPCTCASMPFFEATKQTKWDGLRKAV